MPTESDKRRIVITSLLLGLVVALFIAALLVSHGSRKPPPRHHQTRPTVAVTPMPSGPAASPTPPDLTSLANAWAKRYVAYLNGAPASTLGRVAKQAGGHPTAGQRITVNSVRIAYNVGQATAPITVMATGDGRKYPFTLTATVNSAAQWRITAITPPDLAQDQLQAATTGTASGLPSATAQTATKRFALAYANYRANGGPIPAGMSGSSGAQMQQGTDPLNGTTLATGPVKITAAQFAPPSGSEFTATITLKFHDGAVFALTLLMQGTTHGWVCAGFIGATNPGTSTGTSA